MESKKENTDEISEISMTKPAQDLQTKAGPESGATNVDRFCLKCQYILLWCELLNAWHCEKCQDFLCLKCADNFGTKSTCKCGRCTCCYFEKCIPNSKIGFQCQNVCSICYEESEASSFNLLRYGCGHGLCRICLFKNVISENFDPNICYLCK